MNFLRQERERLGLSGRDVYEKIGVSKGTYIRWEGGHSIPSDMLASLCDIGFDIAFIVTGRRIVPSGILDEVKLEQSIEKSEKLMQLAGKHYSAAQKAKIIGLVYQIYIEENKLSDESLGRILRLVS